MLNYEAIFFTGEVAEFIRSIEGNSLGRCNDEFHCTFKYKPRGEEVFDDIVGEEVECYIIGYGNDGKNSGFEIIFPGEYEEYYVNKTPEGKRKTPHITVSLSEGAKAADTHALEFKRLPKPVKIKGRFGYWLVGREHKGGEISYSKYYEKGKEKALH